MLYKIIDNMTGIIRETNNFEVFKEAIEDLKAEHTQYIDIDIDATQEIPNYTITTYRYYENENEYFKVYFDIKK